MSLPDHAFALTASGHAGTLVILNRCIRACIDAEKGYAIASADARDPVLRADRQVFAECVTEKMLTYALGRGLERYDKKTVRAIAADLEKDDYRFSALVLEIVRSLPFQRRRPEVRS